MGTDCTDHGQWDAEHNKRDTIKVKQEANSLHPADPLNTTVLLLLLTISVFNCATCDSKHRCKQKLSLQTHLGAVGNVEMGRRDSLLVANPYRWVKKRREAFRTEARFTVARLTRLSALLCSTQELVCEVIRTWVTIELPPPRTHWSHIDYPLASLIFILQVLVTCLACAWCHWRSWRRCCEWG